MDLLNASRNYEVFHDGAVGLVRIQVRSVYTSDVHSVARLCLINEVILEYDSDRPGELAGGRPFGHLLEDDLLESVLSGLRKENVIRIHRGLAALTIRSPISIVETPGVLAFLASTLARRGINSLEIVSSHTESTFVLDEKSLLSAFEVLGELIHSGENDNSGEPVSPTGHSSR